MQSDIQSQMSQSQMSQSQMSQSQMSQFQVPHTRNPKPGIMKAAVYKENGIITLEHRPVPALEIGRASCRERVSDFPLYLYIVAGCAD